MSEALNNSNGWAWSDPWTTRDDITDKLNRAPNYRTYVPRPRPSRPAMCTGLMLCLTAVAIFMATPIVAATLWPPDEPGIIWPSMFAASIMVTVGALLFWGGIKLWKRGKTLRRHSGKASSFAD